MRLQFRRVIPVLASALLLAGLGATAVAQGTERPPRPARPVEPGEALGQRMLRGAQGITEPEDPEAVMGTYELDGERVELTHGAFYATYQLLKPHLERPNQPLRKEKVLEHILLLAEAEALGLLPTAEEAQKLNPLARTSPMVADQLRQRWKAQGITEEAATEYARQRAAIERMQLLIGNSVRVLSEQAYELWKTDNQMYRIRYVAFPAARYQAELEAKPADEATLRQFWKTNNQVQSRFRLPTSVSAELFVFDPSTVEEGEIERARAARGKPISDEEALAYFARDRERWMRQIPSAKRHLLYPSEPPPVEELVTPFQILRERIEMEMLLGDRIGAAHREANAATDGFDGEALAKKHGLERIVIDDLSREEITARPELNDRFGQQLFQQLFRSEPGAPCPQIQTVLNVQFFWRLNERRISSLPTFEQAMEKGLAREWVETESFDRARRDAQALLTAMDERGKASRAEAETEIDARWKQRLDDALKTTQDANRRRQYETQFRARAQAEKNQLALSARAEHFEPCVKELGLSTKEHGPFTFTLRRADRSKITDYDEQVKTFLEGNYAIKAVAEGQVTSILSDTISRTHFIVRLEGKEDPPFSKMSAVDYHKRTLQLERQQNYATTYEWTFPRVRVRRKWEERF